MWQAWDRDREKGHLGRIPVNAQEWQDPIGDGPSYYEHARHLLRLANSGQPLRDGFPRPDSHTAHRPRSPTRSDLDELLDALSRMITNWPPSREMLLQLDQLLRNLLLMQDRRELRALILARDDLPKNRLRTLGRRLARTGTHIGAVELGLLLLGVAGNDDDQDTILTLSCLEGPCCCAADALASSQSRPYEALWEMARKSRGWPRIDAIQHMRGATVDQHIRHWLLREACDGDFLDTYIADIVAETGDLAGALAADTADDGLLDGTGWILTAMCDRDVPAPSVLFCSAAEAILAAYAQHVVQRPPTLTRLSTLAFLNGFLHDDKAEGARWSHRLPVIRDLYRRSLSSPFTRQAIAAALTAPDCATADRARWLARHLNLPEAP